MNRIVSGAMAALLIGATAAGAGQAVHAKGTAAASSYYESVIFPQGGGISHGSMAAFPGPMGLKVKFYDGYLKPDEIYREEVRTGACQSGGGVVAQLPRSQADPDGSINFTASVPASALSAATLHVDVVQDVANASVVACGEIYHADMVLRLHSVKTNVVANATGLALFTFNTLGNEVLYRTPNTRGTSVVVFAQGLEPGTLHEEHIHNGTCIPDMNGQARYDLYYMETDPNGEGVSGTFFNGRINLANSYLQVHAANLQSATCGDLGPNGTPSM